MSLSEVSKEKEYPVEDAAIRSADSCESATPKSHWKSFKDSFKRKEVVEGEERLHQTMNKRHLKLMALSTGLGTGLLVAASGKLRNAGPAGVLIGYFIVGTIMLIPTINSVSELSIAYSRMPGGFQAFYSKFIDESVGFALGWNYALQWVVVISLELVVASMTVKFWTTSLHPDVIVAIVMVIIFLINLGGARGYAEAESIMNTVKVLFLTGFVIFGLIIDLGGGPQGFVGGRYYRDPGAFTTFKGLVTVFCTGAFSLGGSEFVSLAAAETKHPRIALRAASKFVYYKVFVLFLGSLLFVGLLVPYDNPDLLGSSKGTNTSPYVLAAQLHGVKVLPHIINAVILISVTSVATAAMYSSPRFIQALAQEGLAPKWFDYIDRQGRPLRAWLCTVVCTFFSFIAAYEKQDIVFNWMLSISALCFVFAWLFICICHLRFRACLKARGIPLSDLAYASQTGVIGSWTSIIINCLILIGQFWIALFPIGSNKPDANNFFQNYLGAVFILVFYFGHKLWTKNWKFYKSVDEIDFDTGRIKYDSEILQLEILEDKERYKRASILKKIYITLFD